MNDSMTAAGTIRSGGDGLTPARVGPGDSALDVCCGTGDFAFELRRKVGPQGTRGRCGRVGGDAGLRPREAVAVMTSTWSSRWATCWPCLLDGVGWVPTASRRAFTPAPWASASGANAPDVARAFSEMRLGLPFRRQGSVSGDRPEPRIPSSSSSTRRLVRPRRTRAGRLVARDSAAISNLPASAERFRPEGAQGADGESAGLKNAARRDPGGAASSRSTMRRQNGRRVAPSAEVRGPGESA